MIERSLIFALLVSCFTTQQVCCAPPVGPFPLQWQKTYAGTNSEGANCIALAGDGGYLVAAGSNSGEGLDKETPSYGDADVWVIRIDAQGNKLWERTFGGTGIDQVVDAKPTLNGGWVLAVESRSDISGNKMSPSFGGVYHYWVLRLDSQGDKVWEKSFGGGYMADMPSSVIAVPDGGFLIAGISQSYTNEIKTVPQFSTLPYGDYWILRLDSEGEIMWQRAFGGTDADFLTAAEACGTNGFILAGSSSSPPSGNKESPLYGSQDFWIILIDHQGNKVWERSYGGDDYEDLFHVRCTKDDGFVVNGWTLSNISGNKTTPLVAQGGFDAWIIRLNSQGERIWERTLGSPGVDDYLGMQVMPDGGIILGGIVDWRDGSFVRLDLNGSTIWEQTFELNYPSGSLVDVQDTRDGGIIAVGSVSAPGSGQDVLVKKFGPDSLTAPHLQMMGKAAHLILSGIAGRRYIVESSPECITWLPWATNTLITNSTTIIDPAGPATKRFYRARMVD